MVLIVRFAKGEKTRNACHHGVGRAIFHELTISGCGVLGPEAAHRIVNTWENSHWEFAGVLAYEFSVDLKDGPKFGFKVLTGLVGEVQIHLVFAPYPHPVVNTDTEDFS